MISQYDPNQYPDPSSIGASVSDRMAQSNRPEVSKTVEQLDKDTGMYVGNPQIAGQRSFMSAVRGIEDGDFQGLEQLDFGAVDGTPAVSFVDEDGQRQVIRLTMPQWSAALEQRSRGRKQLEEAYRSDAIKKALAPQFQNIIKRVEGIEDPVVAGAWEQLYDLDPETAMRLAGESFSKDAPKNVLYGREVSDGLLKAYTAIEGNTYKNKLRQLEQLEYSTNDTLTRGGIGILRSAIRPPAAISLPAEMTLSDWLSAQGSGPMPLVNVINQATVPMGIPGVPSPIIPPAPGPDGSYRPEEFNRWLNQLNQQVLMPMLGWAPYNMNNPQHLNQIVEALNMYNNTRGASLPVPPVQPTVQPRPRAETQRQASEAQASAQQSTGANDREMETPTVSRELEMDLSRYGMQAVNEYQRISGIELSQDANEEEILEAFLAIHDYNTKQIASKREPMKNPPPEIVERVYRAIMGASGG